MRKKLGLVQVRGIGDVVIALPIAHYYYKEGWDVYWPICEEFIPNFKDTAPWVKWIPIPTDTGAFFWDIPMQRLKNFGMDEIICLYQSLTGHPELTARPEFQITGFDQIKYHVADVPFINKWKLSECLTRNTAREQALYDRMVTNENFVVYHTQGSDFKTSFDFNMVPEGWQAIEITEQTDSVFDWLTILEKAQSLVLIDSVYSNIVDQLSIGDDRYFIPRSHIHLTPVLGNNWTVLPPDPETLKRISIFRSG